MRLIGLLILIVEFIRYYHDFECSSGHLVHTYIVGLLVSYTMTIAADVLIVWVSMKGTIINDGPRKSITKFIYARLLIIISEFIWTINGTFSIIHQMPVCDSQPRVYFVACIAVVGGWMTFFVQTLLIFTAFNLTNRGHQAIISKHDWDARWKSVCCCVNVEENKHVFSTLSKLCMELFKKEDLVASDILAGLVLVYFKQHQTREQLDVVDAPLLTGRLR